MIQNDCGSDGNIHPFRATILISINSILKANNFHGLQQPNKSHLAVAK